MNTLAIGIKIFLLFLTFALLIFIMVMPFVCEAHKPVPGAKQELHSK